MFVLPLLILALACTSAEASRDLLYGLGATNAARTGGVLAERDNAFAAVYNPSLLSASDESVLEFGFSAGSLKLSTEPFAGGNRDAISHGPVPVTLWSIGGSFPRYVEAWQRHIGFGVAVSGPFGTLRQLVSEHPESLSLLRYGKSSDQFKAIAGLSAELWPKRLYLGLGLAFYITIAGAGDAVLVSEDPSGRLSLAVGMNTSFLAGLYSDFGKIKGGLVYRHAVDPTVRLDFTGKAEVLGQKTVDIPFSILSSLYYEPHVIEADIQGEFGPTKLSVGLSYQLWSLLKPAFSQVGVTTRGGERHESRLPELSLRDTISPRVSTEFSVLPSLIMSAGYEYRPLAIKDLSGPVNLLDNDTHVVGLSARYRLKPNFLIPLASVWALYVQAHFMEERSVTKTEAKYRGAPGYRFDGNGYYYGLSATLSW